MEEQVKEGKDTVGMGEVKEGKDTLGVGKQVKEGKLVRGGWPPVPAGAGLKGGSPSSSSSLGGQVKEKKPVRGQHSDPHLRSQEEFGVMGKEVKVGKENFVLCTVIGEQPHSNCNFYKESVASNERAYMAKLVESGQYGKREEVERKGFSFKKEKNENIKKYKTKNDRKLEGIAFSWKVKTPTKEKLMEDKKKQEEGEKLAATKKSENKKQQKKIENKEKRNKKKEQKLKRKCKLTKEGAKVGQGVKCEMLKPVRGGWPSVPAGAGLKGGAPSSSSSSVSLSTNVSVCLR